MIDLYKVKGLFRKILDRVLIFVKFTFVGDAWITGCFFIELLERWLD